MNPPAHRHDIAILRCRPDGPAGSVDRAYASGEFGAADRDAILALLAATGHRLAPARLDRRFANGLRFIHFSFDGRPVGSTWIAHGTARYIDEMNWLLPIGELEFWIRDIHVAAHFRGRRAFAAFTRLVAERHVDGCSAVWSDVDSIDTASMRAHHAAGFVDVARVRCLDLFGRLRIRSALPVWPLPVREIEPDARVIWLHGDRLRRHRELIA